MNKTFFLACTCVSAFWLSACATNGGDSGKDRQAELDAAIASASSGARSTTTSVSNTAEEMPPEYKAFLENGFMDSDADAIAKHMGSDVPNAPRLKAQTRVRIAVVAENITSESDVTLNKPAFAKQLLQGLQRTATSKLSYSDDNTVGAGIYRLLCAVSTAPTQSEHAGVQHYEFQIVDSTDGKPVWLGAFDIDAPKAP